MLDQTQIGGKEKISEQDGNMSFGSGAQSKKLQSKERKSYAELRRLLFNASIQWLTVVW